MNWNWTSIESINDIEKATFNTLIGVDQQASPFLSYTFLQALEASKCVGENSGWQAQHIIIKDADTVLAFIPAYIKTHSYGEYVFDHSWAHAYEQHGLDYYPKMSICVPFTPVTSNKILLANNISLQEVLAFLATVKHSIMNELGLSSIHFLFLTAAESNGLAKHDFHQRQSVQFNWHNKNYPSFDAFLETLTARRRRSIRKERKSIGKQDTLVKRIVGSEIGSQDMAFFYSCYQQTYLKRSGHTGYLNQAFFEHLLRDMPDNLMLVVAQTNNTPIASALFLFNDAGLYGRYWGALAEVSGLHFEACYYQGIEFCIERNIPLFNPGTQGEHKILRGFEPTLCYSNHTLLEPAFDDAVRDFLVRETPHINEYKTNSAGLLPFKQNLDDPQEII